MKDRKKEIKLQATDENLDLVLDTLEEFLGPDCDMMVKNEILISIEELFVNIAHYAYGNEVGEAILSLEMLEEEKRIRMVLKDQGIPFNPLEKEDPNIELSAEERKIGGLGIFMVKDYMDYLEYHYEDSYNIMIIEKNL